MFSFLTGFVFIVPLNMVQLVDEQLEEDCKNEEVYDDDDVDRDDEGGDDEDDNNNEEEEW